MAAAYIVISNMRVREVEIIQNNYEFCIVRLDGNKGGIRIRRNRIYRTKEEAELHLPYKTTVVRRGGYASPYDYEW